MINMENQTPEVSVIIPCYNSHLYLDQTLLSLEHQSFDNFEVIIVNDGSSDPDTISFLECIDSRKYKVINLDQNRGLPAARNAGISAAVGKFVLPLDSDDWLAPEAVEEMLKVIKAIGSSAFVYSSIYLHNEKDGILHKQYNPFEQLFFNQIPYCILFEKDIWRKVGGYDEYMRGGYEDWEFNLRLIHFDCHGTVIRKPFLNYRVSSNGMLLSSSLRQHAEIWHYIMKKYPNSYTASGLLFCWNRWRGTPSNKPLAFYLVWILIFKILPFRVTNKLFLLLRVFSSSNNKKFRIKKS